MINRDSLRVTGSLTFGEQFVRPAYSSYCFAHLPDTVKRLFGLEYQLALPEAVLPDQDGNTRVIIVLVDGFGWEFYERTQAASSFLRHIAKEGVVSRLTSMFPSTTSAHVTCLNSGQPVAQSGVYEWFYYEPKLDQVIAPLLFSPAGERTRDLLAQQGIQPKDIYPSATLYQDLAEVGVKSFSCMPDEFAWSSFSGHISRGAEIIPYHTWSEALTNLGLLLEQSSERFYAMLYYPNLDAVAHTYGPDGRHLANELDTFLLIMAQFLEQLQRSAARQRTLLLITADHGFASTNPASTVYLNLSLPDLISRLRVDKNGNPILFGGSPRDLFLYIQDQHLEYVQFQLQTFLAGKAEVYTTQVLVEAGFFGPGPLTEPLASRLGNLVVLPYAGESVGWYEKDKFVNRYYGHHGGLTPHEMLIPLLAIQLA